MAGEEGSGGRVKPFKVGQAQAKNEHGRRAERKLSKRFGARLTPASGALDFAKADMTLANFRIESKSTLADSYRVTLNDLIKIAQQAVEKGEQPAFVVQFVDDRGEPKTNGSWVMIPERVFKEGLNA